MGIKLRKQIDKPASNVSEAEVLNEVDTKLKRIKRVFGEDISDEQAEKYKDFLQAFKKAHKGESRADQEWILRQMKAHNGEIPQISAGSNGMVNYTFSDGTSNELATNLDNPAQYINDQRTIVGNGSQVINGDVQGDAVNQANVAGDHSVVQGMNINGAGDGDASQKINGTGQHTPGHGTGNHGHGNGATPTNPAPTTETPGETPPAATQPGSNWWDFFGSKDFLIGLAAVTAIAGIIAAIKSLGNTIKARFRKTAKVLYNMQKDFGTSANGLDMDHALKGVGSKITDFFVKMFGSGEKGKGAIGLRPFVDNYRNEMKRDLDSAMKSWNVVSQAGQQKPEADIPTQKSESNEVVYNSFFEAAQAGKLFESNGQPVTESLTIGAVMAGLTLGRLALRGGQYVWSKFGSDGKKEDSTVVAVTKQSTREVCWSIMNAFFVKYFNCEGVAKKLGVDVQSLGDIDASNVDKFAKIVEQMKGEQADNKKVSIMFNRVKKGYDSMVERYLKIATNVVNNFEKYTKLKKGKNGEMMTEKESNLLVGGTEKLRAELDRQKDQYENNFYRVVNAIVSSDEYISYIDFIISQVIPVFKSGLASDADFVLDVMPKKGELYVIRQTNQDQGNEGGQPDAYQGAKGLSNVGLVEVIGVDAEGEKNKKNPIIKFKRRALLIGNKITDLSLNDEGKYDLSGLSSDNYDTKAFAKDVRNDNGENNSNLTDVELPYNKWAALDPHVAINAAIKADTDINKHTSEIIGMQRQGENGEDELLFIIPEEPKQEAISQEQPSDSEKPDYKPDSVINEEGEQEGTQQEHNKAMVSYIEYVKPGNSADDSKAISINVQGKGISVEAFKDFAKQPGEGENKMGFTEIDAETTKEEIEDNKDLLDNADKAQANNQQEVPPIINGSQKGENQEDGGNVEEEKKKVQEYTNTIVENINKITNNILDSYDKPIDKQVYAKIFKTINNKEISLIDSSNTTPLTYKYGNSSYTGIYYSIPTSLISNNEHIYLGYSLIGAVNKNFVDAANNATVTSYPSLNDLKMQIAVILFFKESKRIISFGLSYPQNLSDRITRLFDSYQEYLNKQVSNNTAEQKSESVIEAEQVEYSTNMKLEEMTNLNTIKVTRNIKSSIDTKGLYILSESCWGDGSIARPAKYLNESYESIKNSCNNYSELASYVKTHKHCSLVPFNESYEVKVQAPYNRYAMLTEGCALYEHLSYIQFNNTEDKEISHIYNVGVYKFIK